MEKIEHFFLMDERARQVVDDWIKKASGMTKKQKDFIADIHRALYVTNYNYYILMHELNGYDGHIIANSECSGWIGFAKHYYKNGNLRSDLANKNEVFLWYAFRVALDLWTLEGVCDEKIVYPSCSPYNLRESGQTYCGGFSDGIGNTPKLIKNDDKLVILGDIYPVNGSNSAIDMRVITHPKNIYPFCTGILVIK